jgi:hypothetical protein
MHVGNSAAASVVAGIDRLAPEGPVASRQCPAANQWLCPHSREAEARAQLRRAAMLCVRLVALACGTEETALLADSRGSQSEARARQIAIYLLHTALSVPYGEIARFLGRDRTTVSHACRLVEDLRDEPVIDTLLERLEHVLEPVAANCRSDGPVSLGEYASAGEDDDAV